jgi:2-(1,2-epoxy-1,2-dihydrophenyl)acetyl-CoA isomerase
VNDRNPPARNAGNPLVTTALGAGVLTITLNAPHTGNALDLAMTDAIAGTLENVPCMPDVHCVLLRSSGRHFCTGGNVKDMARGADLMAGTTTDIQDRLRLGLHRITRAMRDLEVPSVGAVNGAAVGAGFDLALMCDLRVAARSARFAESFLRLGLVSGIGGAWFLARAVGVAKAMELTLTSEYISAETAAELRIVSRVVDDDRLAAEAEDLARTIAAQPPRALRMAKRLVRESAESGLSAALEMAAAMQAILLSGDEHRASVTQFLENRR